MSEGNINDGSTARGDNSRRDPRRSGLTRRALLARAGATGLAALGAPALLAACTQQATPSASAAPAGASAAASAKAGGTLTVAWHIDAYSSTLGSAMDPHGLPGGVPWWYLWEQVYDRLVTPGDDLSMQPFVATAWKQTSPTTWVIDLRQDVKFSNGRAMTVDDVVGSIQRLTSPDHKNSWQGQFGAVDSVVASGPSQVTITTKTARVALPAALAGPPASILAMKELNAGTFDPAKQTLGTGPFVVDSHTNNESWTFVRNPYYWRQGLPKADKLIVQIIPDENARLAALRNGTVGACFFERLDSARLLEGVPNIKTVVQNNASIWYLAVNNSPSSIFQDIRLRQAVALAVDRDKIVKVALNGVGTPSAVVPTPFNVCDPKSVPFGTPDLNQARQLVQQAGATGKNISIIAGTFDANHSPIAQVLQQDLKAIGFGDVSILPLEAGVMVDRVYTGNKADFDLIVNSTSGYGDPAAMVSLWFNPEAAVIDKAWLPPDPDMLSLITKIGSTPLGQARNDLLVDACKRAAQGANWIPLVTKARIIGFRSDLVAPRVQPLETYADPLRHLAEYAALK